MALSRSKEDGSLKVKAHSPLRSAFLWRVLRKVSARISRNLVPIRPESVSNGLTNAWKNDSIPNAQALVVARELRALYAGDVIPTYDVLIKAVKRTGCEFGRIIEIGCATGYYSEALRHLLGHEIQYCGMDYSESMVAEAHRRYPSIPFEIGDATALPIKDQACDILISGCVLLHVPKYVQAIAESVRVSRRWVIFHRTPIIAGNTIFFRKKAYGVTCVEIHFGEGEFKEICANYGLHLVKALEITRRKNESLITFLFEKSLNRMNWSL